MLHKRNGSLATNLGATAYATLALAVFAICSPDDWLRSRLWVFYAIQYAFIVRLVFILKDRWLFVLSPSFVTVSYIVLNNCLGAYSFSVGRVISKENYWSYLEWTDLGWIAAFFLFANFVVILPYFCTRKLQTQRVEMNRTSNASPIEKFLVIGFCGGILLFFSIVEWKLDFLGGTGNFSTVPQALACLSIVLALVKYRQRGRCVAYVLLLFWLASFSSFDKRHAIFLLAPIAFIECLRMDQLRFRPRLVAIAALWTGIVLTLVIMMSIYRGYGGYQPADFLDTPYHIHNYVKDKRFYEYLGNNLEFNYSFFHSHMAIGYVYDSPALLLFGSTFLKILFIPFPRSSISFKPESIVTHYTRHHEPYFYSDGGSRMTTIYVEFFWNFHIAGLLGLLLIYYLATRGYLALAYRIRQGVGYRHLLALFAYHHMLTLVRGSGFDLYFVYLLIGAGFVLIIFHPAFVIFRACGHLHNRWLTVHDKNR